MYSEIGKVNFRGGIGQLEENYYCIYCYGLNYGEGAPGHIENAGSERDNGR